MKILNRARLTLTTTCAAFALCAASPSFASLIYRIDIDTTEQRTSITTESGWTSLDASQGNNATVTVGSVTFGVFSAAGSRNRGNSNALMRDFIFDDGNAAAVGLTVSGLAAGIWEAAVYAWDASFTVGRQIVGISQFQSAPETVFTSDFVANETTPYKFQFDSSALIDGFGIFTRENNDNSNRARFNALELTLLSSPVPVPATLLLVVLGLLGIGARGTRIQSTRYPRLVR